MTDETEINNDGAEQNMKTIELLTPKPFDLEIGNLGVVKVGRLTMKALIELSPNLNPMADTDDVTLVRALMAAVSRIPSEVEGEDGRRLTDSECQLVTEADLERFAKSFMEEEKWEADRNEEGQFLAPIPALAKAFRFQVEQMGAATRKMMEGLKEIISPATQQVFMKNTALSARLKELGGINTIFPKTILDSMKSLNKRAYSPYSEAANTSRKIGNFGGIDSIIKGAGTDQKANPTARVLSIEQFTTPHIDTKSLFENNPANRTAQIVTELNRKAEEVVEIARGMAVALGNTNDMVSQAMTQFEVKRIDDTQDIKNSLKISSRNLWIATGSLIVSVLIGLAS